MFSNGGVDMKIGITADVNLTSTDIINLQLANFAPKPL
jgi:putative glutamine amidotransferase